MVNMKVFEQKMNINNIFKHTSIQTYIHVNTSQVLTVLSVGSKDTNLFGKVVIFIHLQSVFISVEENLS